MNLRRIIDGSGADVQAPGIRRRSRARRSARRSGDEAADLLQIAAQGGECRLRSGKISGLQSLRQRAERLVDGAVLLRTGGCGLRALRVMMVTAMAAVRLLRVLLGVLLHRGVVLLRSLQVSRLQVFAQLRERLRRRIRGGLSRARDILRKGGEILLRLRQVSGLQILPQLLKLRFDLLEVRRRVLDVLVRLRVLTGRSSGGKQIAAQDSNDRHDGTPSENPDIKSGLRWAEAGSQE